MEKFIHILDFTKIFKTNSRFPNLFLYVIAMQSSKSCFSDAPCVVLDQSLNLSYKQAEQG